MGKRSARQVAVCHALQRIDTNLVGKALRRDVLKIADDHDILKQDMARCAHQNGINSHPRRPRLSAQ